MDTVDTEQKLIVQVHGGLVMALLEMIYFFVLIRVHYHMLKTAKNNFLILGLGPTYGMNGSFDSPEKKFSINFTKANTKFWLSLHYNADNSNLFGNGKEIIKFKADNKNVKFPTQFRLGIISDRVGATESREVSLNGNVYDFSVDYNSVDKSDILNIHKNLMSKNNIKLFSYCLLYYWVLVAL